MNPDTNKFEPLSEEHEKQTKELQRMVAGLQVERTKLVRPDGSPVPDHWPIFRVDELIEVKGYTFKVAHIGESHLLLEPTGPVIVGNEP